MFTYLHVREKNVMKRLGIVLIVLTLVLSACGVNIGAPTSTPTQTSTPEASPSADASSTPTPVPDDGVALEMPDLGIIESDYPRVDGSTATIPLAEALAALVLDKPRAECEEYAVFTGTTKSYAALINGETDLLLSYEPAQDSLDHKSSAGFEWDMTAIGKDALVFIVNKDNPLTSLTTEQVRDIYTGRITNWRDVGGPDIKIEAFQRNLTAGSQTMMNKLVMKGAQMAEAPKDYSVESMEGLISAIANYNNTSAAIGYSVYYYAKNMNPNEGLRFLAIDGVEPTTETIRSGAYPHVNEFYAVIARFDTDSSARKLYDFMISATGQALVDHEGYVSVLGS